MSGPRTPLDAFRRLVEVDAAPRGSLHPWKYFLIADGGYVELCVEEAERMKAGLHPLTEEYR